MSSHRPANWVRFFNRGWRPFFDFFVLTAGIAENAEKGSFFVTRFTMHILLHGTPYGAAKAGAIVHRHLSMVNKKVS